jgi:hypothetical protein
VFDYLVNSMQQIHKNLLAIIQLWAKDLDLHIQKYNMQYEEELAEEDDGKPKPVKKEAKTDT